MARMDANGAGPASPLSDSKVSNPRTCITTACGATYSLYHPDADRFANRPTTIAPYFGASLAFFAHFAACEYGGFSQYTLPASNRIRKPSLCLS